MMYHTDRLGLLIAVLAVGGLPTPSSAAESPFQYPIDVVAGADGVLYVADLRLPGIWKVAEGQAEVFVQASKTFRTPLNAIRCLALDVDGQLLAGDSATREVYRVAADGQLTPLTGGQVGIPMCLVATEAGIYASDLELQRIWLIPSAGGEPREVAALAAVRGIDRAADGLLWVATGIQPNVATVTPEGVVQPILDDAKFSFTNQLTLGKDGIAYVADGYRKTIWKVTADGSAEPWVTGPPFDNPVGLSWRGEELLVCDSRANAIFAVTPDGTVSRVFPAE